VVKKMPEPAIIVKDLSKSYRLGVIGRQTLQDEVRYWWHKIRGHNPLEYMGKIGEPTTNSSSSTQHPVPSIQESASSNENPNTFWALKDISFEVEQGEVLGIIGRNGAGKTTLLKILTRITEPTSGIAAINGRVASLLEVGTGFHPELTGRENIFLNGSILGMKKDEITSKFEEIVEFAELQQFIDTPVKRYSSGMYVRLAFAVAAHLDPEILLIDEVLAVGDVEFQKKCLGKMKDVAGQGRTILFVSHNMTAIQNLCKRVLLIDKGRVTEDGTADGVISRYLDRNLLEGAIASATEIEKRMEGVILRENPIICFKEISLRDQDGLSRKVFDSDEIIVVSVVFECFQPVRNLRMMVLVVDENNTNIFGTHNMDDKSIATKFLRIGSGVFNASCIFPANTFGERSFFLTVHLENPKIEHLVVNKILEFEVKGKAYNQDLQYVTGKGVFIWPQIKWGLQPISSMNPLISD
jgi:lipopolysaccharide transport system ATP-binding protein